MGKNNKTRILFYGTPYFAVPSLKALIEADYNVVGVVTAPDKKAGRGMKLQMSDVKKAAIELDIPVFQPTNLKSETFQETLKELNPTIQIVIAFRMMPVKVWDFPPMGTFNLHGSLLPKYRGAAPIHHAIINGEKETGVTTFFLKHEIDTGNVLMSAKCKIEETDTVGSVHDKLMLLGADLVVKTMDGLLNESIVEKEQGYTQNLPHAPKLSKEFCEIDWTKTAPEVYNFIRGLNPFPVARTFLDGKILKIYASEKTSIKLAKPIEIQEGKLYIQCCDSALEIKELQLEGKKRMFAEDFLKGYSGEIVLSA